MKTTTLCLAACAAIGLSSACLADDMVAAEQFGGTSIGFLLKSSLSRATLSVSGPDAFHASVYSESGAIALDLGKFGPVEDGFYKYEITAATDQPRSTSTVKPSPRAFIVNLPSATAWLQIAVLRSPPSG